MALPQSMDPELRRRIEAAADRSDTSVDAWLERAVKHELEREARDEPDDAEIVELLPGLKPVDSTNPERLRGGKTMAETSVDEREERDRLLAGGAHTYRAGQEPRWYREDMAIMPPRGAKPKGSENPPKLRDGKLISDAVIEDRR